MSVHTRMKINSNFDSLPGDYLRSRNASLAVYSNIITELRNASSITKYKYTVIQLIILYVATKQNPK